MDIYKTFLIILFIGLVIQLKIIPGFSPERDLSGSTLKIFSQTLNEERTLSISLPEVYQTVNQAYPVLYVLDAEGGTLFPRCVSTVEELYAKGLVPQMIVVGIWNTLRNRDMIPEAVSHRPGSGGSQKFLEFIKSELIPYIKKNYRTTDFSLLYGMSNSALFSVYALLESPETFNAYIASSPMIGHCPEFIHEKAEAFVRQGHVRDRILYMIYGTEDSRRVADYVPDFKECLKSNAPKNFLSHLEILEGEGHVPASSLARGLQFVFSKDESSTTPPVMPSNDVIPAPTQVEYQKMEFIGFIHFTVNTFTDKEWGYGDESEQVFNPTGFDPGQWARVAKSVGMKELILTAKHHDGFCLWPSRYTEHSVKNSPWKNGKGDIVREFVDACQKYGLKVGLYLSPWDRNHADYGTPAYIEYYWNQLKELLKEYGEISEIWFDGANGGTGYYGGADESRHIDRTTYYRWDETWSIVKSLQPRILIFSDAGPDIRWIGNEKGYAGETNWSTINSDAIIVGAADQDYLNSGDPNGKNWVVPLCNTSIRPGWFYHESENDLVKTPVELVDVYYKSVGRNGVLLLNVPPDKRGLFHENDIKALREFKSILDGTFRTNLASGKKVEASNYRMRHKKFAPSNIVDGDVDSYWATDDNIRQATLEIDLGGPVLFDRILIQEPIRFGQRISKFEILGRIDGKWISLAQGTTIGYKRLLQISPVDADKIRLILKESNNIPSISNFGLFRASEKEKGLSTVNR